MNQTLLRMADATPGGAPQDSAAPPAPAKVDKPSETDASEIVKLRRSLDDEKSSRKKDQERLCMLEDENRTLKTPPAAKPAEPKKEDDDAWTFFG